MHATPRIPIALLAVSIALLALGWMRSVRSPESVKRTQVALGTFVDIEVRDSDSEKADLAIAAAFQEVQRIHREFSPFNKSGPLYLLNQSDEDTVPVSRELYDLLLACDAVHKKTEGAFDPAMEALFRVWRIWGEHPVVPSEEAVQAARTLSGWNRVRLDEGLTITRPPGVEISFGAIAKGYAVDRMAEILREHGVQYALCNAGGEIRTLGGGWVVGIQHPSIREGLVRKISLAGMAVATSGDYEQHHEEKGKRYHHILDPATGYPAEGSSSVTVIAPTCIEADAYATGIFVLGPERGMDLVNRTPGMEAMLIDKTGAVLYSEKFKDYLWRQP
ncbi:MAG: FAD:protein FMN transferase [Acidobacteria bacterium]|nr:FAD:protein FMN transferase [Acidobacteriota bacterium]